MAKFTSYVFYKGGGSGGGLVDTSGNQWFIYGEIPGPTSYPTGGFTVDLDATITTMNFLKLAVKTIGSLPVVEYRVLINGAAGNGKAKVSLFKKMYDRVSSFDNITGQPAGVTVRATSGGTSSSEAAHTHSAAHDHPAQLSAAMTAAGAGVDTDALAPAIDTHTHSVDLPNLPITTSAGTSHNHTDNTLYQHQHSLGATTTNLTRTEIANGTDLSATRWYLFATGVAR